MILAESKKIKECQKEIGEKKKRKIIWKKKKEDRNEEKDGSKWEGSEERQGVTGVKKGREQEFSREEKKEKSEWRNGWMPKWRAEMKDGRKRQGRKNG